jgi:hypothetical protein
MKLFGRANVLIEQLSFWSRCGVIPEGGRALSTPLTNDFGPRMPNRAAEAGVEWGETGQAEEPPARTHWRVCVSFGEPSDVTQGMAYVTLVVVDVRDRRRDHPRVHAMAEPSHAEHELAAFRAAKDAFLAQDPHSPLDHEQRHAFQGLAYYPYTPALRLELPLDRDVPDEVVEVDTSTGETQQYRRAGTIRFAVAGQPAKLTLYQGEQGELFLPLRDATAASETYGAGRYLEPQLLDEGVGGLQLPVQPVLCLQRGLELSPASARELAVGPAAGG